MLTSYAKISFSIQILCCSSPSHLFPVQYVHKDSKRGDGDDCDWIVLKTFEGIQKVDFDRNSLTLGLYAHDTVQDKD
ncbi:hypothetical protein D9758_015875 [Tetrapyrgos nigripes]|uniref:Uncharacterized protein n=1 Tax=Tetrapyrgos nigripes TaxID=182062 RepID=A0A8H5CJL5_9AGAR|nr:hypothetical protein D9758_015875 [Tetrapyrgos nigripes]